MLLDTSLLYSEECDVWTPIKDKMQAHMEGTRYQSCTLDSYVRG